MIGMLAAVFLYRPIYKQMYALADVSSQVELVEQYRIEKTIAITPAGDSLITQQKIKFYSEGHSVVERAIQTIPGQNSATEAKSEVKLDCEDHSRENGRRADDEK